MMHPIVDVDASPASVRGSDVRLDVDWKMMFRLDVHQGILNDVTSVNASEQDWIK